jgi:hypothetical protein
MSELSPLMMSEFELLLTCQLHEKHFMIPVTHPEVLLQYKTCFMMKDEPKVKQNQF